MKFEERIIDTILNLIKDNQVYLTQKENLPQLAKLGYMYNTLWYGCRTASYNGIIDKLVINEDNGIYTTYQCSDNPKYKIEMCEPENDEIEDYIYGAWGMHVDNGYGPGWEEFKKIMTIGKTLTELEIKGLNPNKTFDEWVEILTDPSYKYSSIYPDRRSVANHLLCVIGNGYSFENGFVIIEYESDYGDWMNAKFRDDIQEVVNKVISDPEVEIILRYIDKKSSEYKAQELEKEIKLFGMSFDDFCKSKKGKSDFEFSYYPISNHSIISKFDKNTDPSYIKAGIEICEDLLKSKKEISEYQLKFAKDFLSKFS